MENRPYGGHERSLTLDAELMGRLNEEEELVEAVVDPLEALEEVLRVVEGVQRVRGNPG